MYPRLIPLFLLSSLTSSHGQLSATFVSTRLPTPLRCHTPHYPGSGDVIYLFGGCTDGTESQILTFSISTETISRIATLPGSAQRGTIQSSEDGHIFYFGGTGSLLFAEVYKFDPILNTTEVFTLPYDVQDGHSIDMGNDIVHIFGGDGQTDNLLAYNLRLNNYSAVASLSRATNQGASVHFGESVFIFATSGEGKALQFYLPTRRIFAVGPATLPVVTEYPAAVRDKEKGYLIGGYRGEGGRTEGIYMFDPVTFESEFLLVTDFPVGEASYWLMSPASVWVEGLDRIYCFGGQSFNGTSAQVRDEIFYVDLEPIRGGGQGY